MEVKYFHLLSCIFLLFLLNPFSVFSHIHSPHHHDTKSPSPPLDFLKNLIGARKGTSAKGISQLKKYLSKIGHTDSYNNNKKYDDLFDDTLESSIMGFQSYFSLTTNGILDAKTVEQMMQPRCGVPDNGDFTSHLKNKIPMGASKYHLFPSSPKWPPTKRNLTYSFTSDIRTDVNRSISNALNLWASVSPLRFTYVQDYTKADIKISFHYKDHGDGNPFDGPGGIWGHVYYPSDGRLHFDGDEMWVDGVTQGALDLQTVGLHELGHVLGLAHTTFDSAIMYPYIGTGLRKGLDSDDIRGIKDLYPLSEN